MDRLSNLENFLLVLDQGSFSAAARARRISQPAISQQMAALEQHYQTPLLQRSPGGIKPTRAGQILARHAQAMLEQHRIMQAELVAMNTQARGEFRISISQFMAQSVVGETLQCLCTRHPDLELLIKVEDRLVDVVSSGYDLALRAGRLGDCNGIARKIGNMGTVLIASTKYLDKVTRPRHPDDLINLGHIQYNENRTNGFLPLSKDGQDFEAAIINAMVVEAPTLFHKALENGYGFARVPAMIATPMMNTGDFEIILPEYQVAPKDLYLVYPHRHALTHSALVVIRAILDALETFEATEVLSFAGLPIAA